MGIPLLENQKFFGFSASWFQSVLVSNLGGRGAVGIPLLEKVAWFLGFSVSWFQNFLVSKCLGFEVSWFPSLLVSKCQSFNDPMLPKFHFMLSGRYWSHLQDFQDFIRQIFIMLWCPSFPKSTNILGFQKIAIYRKNFKHIFLLI